MKDWLKWGLILSGIYIMVNIITYGIIFLDFNDGIALPFAFVIGFPLSFFMSTTGLGNIAVFINLIIWFTIGALISLLISKLKQKKETTNNQDTKPKK